MFEAGKGFAPTGEGTPQGGVISPCLLSVALHGLEEAAGVRYRTLGTHTGKVMPGSRWRSGTQIYAELGISRLGGIHLTGVGQP